MEFLGDAILDAVVADIVYKRFEGKREGFLTNTRSKIVQRETLNRLAIEIGLDKLIKYTARQSSHNSYMCGNAFEALVGAIYLDRGYRACEYFMEHRIIGSYINLENNVLCAVVRLAVLSKTRELHKIRTLDVIVFIIVISKYRWSNSAYFSKLNCVS